MGLGVWPQHTVTWMRNGWIRREDIPTTRIKPPDSLHNNCWHGEPSDSATNWIDGSIAKVILRFIGGPAGGVVYHGGRDTGKHMTQPFLQHHHPPINRWMIRKDIGNMRAQWTILSLSTKQLDGNLSWQRALFFFFFPASTHKQSGWRLGCWDLKGEFGQRFGSCDPPGSCYFPVSSWMVKVHGRL